MRPFDPPESGPQAEDTSERAFTKGRTLKTSGVHFALFSLAFDLDFR
jgi:hypothetical protein